MLLAGPCLSGFAEALPSGVSVRSLTVCQGVPAHFVSLFQFRCLFLWGDFLSIPVRTMGSETPALGAHISLMVLVLLPLSVSSHHGVREMGVQISVPSRVSLCGLEQETLSTSNAPSVKWETLTVYSL